MSVRRRAATGDRGSDTARLATRALRFGEFSMNA
jgi:hypothetical protein